MWHLTIGISFLYLWQLKEYKTIQILDLSRQEKALWNKMI